MNVIPIKKVIHLCDGVKRKIRQNQHLEFVLDSCFVHGLLYILTSGGGWSGLRGKKTTYTSQVGMRGIMRGEPQLG